MALYVGKPANLTLSGALVAIKLWVPREVKSAIPPIDTLAEIDTALTYSCIQEGVATSLGLEPISMIKTTSITALTYEVPMFRIRMVFPEGNMSFEVNVIEVPYMMRHHARIKCLIGRDILQYSTLNYNGQANTFSLVF